MIKELFKHVDPFRRAALLAPLFTTLEVVIGVLIPYVTSWIIDKGIMAGNMSSVCTYGLLMVFMAALSLLFGIMAGRFSALASTGFAYSLRDAMYANIQTFSFSNIDKFSSSGLITRMTTDISNLQNAFQTILRASVRAPLNLVFSVFMCIFINFKMSMVFFVALIVLGTCLYFVISHTVKLFVQVFQRYDDLNGTVQENLSAIRVVKAFVREDYEYSKFQKATQALYRLFVKTESLQAINHPVMMLVVYGSIISLSWLGAQYIIIGELTTGELTSLFTYVMTILSSLMMLSMTVVQITMSSASAKRVMEVLSEKASIRDPEGGGKKIVTSGAIVFDHVSFSYTDVQGNKETKEVNRRSDEKTFALSNVSLRIHAGETVGIIGGTGSGKSTLAMLVARLYDVTSGSVMVDGTDVRDYAVNALRNAVCVVLQDGRLFSGTVLDNLRWGNEDATRKECIRACQLACADEFVSQMPHGYDSLIEQNGANLSGGQRQRLCLARALLRRPKILILDDSTSACDTVTDARIRKALREESPDTTKLIVAQRMESVRDADRIIVMESGHVVGFDTHERLLTSNAVYQEIARTQHHGE